MKEHFPHDVCPKCGRDTIPAEGVPDQSLRGCDPCSYVFFEDLSRPATTHPDKPTVIYLRTTLALRRACMGKARPGKLAPWCLGVLAKASGYKGKL